ncbi:unnamed protein product [Alternaria burnsii]|nr:unnamed protein product [Alternaria burnsii]
MPSRRAIACVTCAKAKTKCNKALPSCSRCITKGIKCQPRSTRRTSDNHGRSSVKKQPRLPRYPAVKAISNRHLHVSSVSLPVSKEPGITSATPYVDSERTATSSCQDSGLPGFPMLGPILSQGPQVSYNCYAHVDGPMYDPSIFARPIDMDNHLYLGAISPHTPSPVTLYENVSVLNDLDYHQYDDSWSDEMHMLDGFGFEVSAAGFLPETWVVPNSTNMVPTEQVPWSLYDLPDLLQYKPDESVSHLGGMASSAQYQFGNDLDSIQPESTFYRPTVTDMTVLTSAPFMYDLNAATSYAPVWEGRPIP